MATTKFCQGISDISDGYSGFILDQWGVLHNGETAYDGVLECLKELRGRHKYIIILSNSGSREATARDFLKKTGIGPELYDRVLTSGEFMWEGIQEQNEGVFRGLGDKCFVLGDLGDDALFEGGEVELTEDLSKARFVLISGAKTPGKTLEEYEPQLREIVRRQLRTLCANPDSSALIGGDYVMGAGMIARRIQEFGGVVQYIGKPYPPIFQKCIRILQEKEIYPGQTVVIGDTMAHDIMGGAAVSLDTCLIKSGIHASIFKQAQTPAETNKLLNNLCAQYNGIRPTYLVEKFQWGKALPDRKHRKRAS